MGLISRVSSRTYRESKMLSKTKIIVRNLRDHYKTLGIPASASSKKIKTAYLRKCKLYHQDHNMNPNANEQFIKVKEAYQVLSDKEKRQNSMQNVYVRCME